MLPQVPLTDAERAEVDARPEKLALGGAGGFQARGLPRCLVVTLRSASWRGIMCLLQRFFLVSWLMWPMLLALLAAGKASSV